MKCKRACANLFRISNIRRFLMKDACNALMLGLVIVHLDYANGLYASLPKSCINKLQRIQNMAAKVVLCRKKQDSATECLKALHWLPICVRIKYKICVMVFKCLNGLAPSYLNTMLHKPHVTRETRSSQDTTKLSIPPTKKRTFADRAFSVSGPRMWNSLPSSIHTSA